MSITPAKRVKAKKYEGDDAYSWALFVNNIPVMTGMDRREALSRKRKAVANLKAGRRWNQDG